jgi:hypothetical protein
VAFDFGRWGACAAIMGSAACGVSVTQPISAGVVSTIDEAGTGAAGLDAPGSDPLLQGLVAYWKLDESGSTDGVVDSSGKGHTGVPINGPLPSSSTPQVRFSDPSSRAFDGTSQYVLISNSDEMNFEGEITLAAWVYIAAVTDGCHYIVAHGYCWDPPGEVALRLGTDTCGPGGSPHNWAAGAWLSAEHSAVAPLYAVDLQTWIHIAGVYDGQTWRLYRNGIEIARQDSTVGSVPVQSDWAIGARAPGVPPCVPAPVERFFDGSIDDVRIYRRALSASEMLELYHQ